MNMNDSGATEIDCIVMLAAVPWRYIAQAQQHFARHFAERGIRVIYVEPFPHRIPRIHEGRRAIGWIKKAVGKTAAQSERDRFVSDGITIITPLALPETNRLFLRINRMLFVPRIVRMVAGRCGDSPVVQVWKPLDGHLAIVQSLKPRLLVYSCVDNYSAQFDAPKHYVKTEAMLAKTADLVIATSQPLRDRLKKWASYVEIRPRAVDFEVFNRAATLPPTSYQRLCYFGAISDRLNYDILKELAHRGYRILLLGPVKRCPINTNSPPDNIEFHAPVPYGEVPSVIKETDCLIIPYKCSAATQAITPTKIFECLATGKPLISTPVGDLGDFANAVYLAETPSAFLKVLKELPASETQEKRELRLKLASNMTWEKLVTNELLTMRHAIRRKGQVTV